MPLTLLALKALSKTQYIVMIGAILLVVFTMLIVLFELAYKRRVKKYNKRLETENAKAEVISASNTNVTTDESTIEEYHAQVLNDDIESGRNGTVFGESSFDASRHEAEAMENESLKLQVAMLKSEVEELKNELTKQGNSRGIRITGHNADVRALEEELFKAREQYNYMGEQLKNTVDENEKLDIYIKRITLLEKIMKIGSGIEKIKNSYEYEARSQYGSRSNNRGVYLKLMEQVRRLNDRIDSMERNRAKQDDDYYSSNYNKR